MNRLAFSRNHRRGVSAVEFALLLPLILLLLLGAIEAGRAVMVRQSLEDAARAACRVYAVKHTTEQQARDIAEQALHLAGVQNHSVQLDPSLKQDIDEPLEPITVTVSVAYADVSWLPAWFMSGKTITAECTLPADLEVLSEADTGAVTVPAGDDDDGGGGDDDDD